MGNAAAGGLLLDTEWLRTLIALGAIGVARTTGLLLITPFLGKGVLTGLARNGVILSLSLPVLPLLLAGRPDATPDLFAVLGLVVKELLVGVLLGLPIAATSWGLEAAGFVIDNQRGATMASSLNPATGNQSSPLGILLAQVYTTWLFVAGGFLALLDVLYRSMVAWPVWSFQPVFGPAFPGAMLGLLDSVMRLGILMAGPAMIAMFLSEFGLALISRFAPSLQVFFLAMPLKSGVGILVLLLSMGVLLVDTAQQVPTPAALLQAVTRWMS